MNDIRAITIDLDDTLWEIHPVIHRAERLLREWLQAHFPRVTEQFSPDAARELRRDVAAEHPEQRHDLTFLRRAVLRRMGEAAGYRDDFVDAAMEVFSEARNAVDVFPEVRPALSDLRERYVLVAVTNGNADLARIGIADLFDDFVSAGMAGAAKPDRQIFDAAVAAAGATPAQTLHVGDHPHYDVDGARQAGLRTAWVNRTAAAWPDDLRRPDVIVEHVGQLHRLLTRSPR